MTTAIIYATDKQYLDKTIDDLIDKTPHLTTIIVCDDANLAYRRDGITVLSTPRIGRAKAWNQAVTQTTADTLIFLKDKTKVGAGWWEPLQARLATLDRGLLSPVVHTLDLSFWTTEASRWRRFGWRWDLQLYDRAATQTSSPAISSYCIVCKRAWLEELGGFDGGMNLGAGEDIELALRNWLCGGTVEICDTAQIAVALEVDRGPQTLANLARIMEVWLPGYVNYFYRAHQLTSLNPGRLTNLLKLQQQQTRPIEWFLSTQQPELLSGYDLSGIAAGKSVAVVGPGPSLDYLNPALINRHDLIIGIDYVGLLYDCDYVMTNSVPVVAELRRKYADNKFIVPLLLQDRALGAATAAVMVIPAAHQIELAAANTMPVSLDPPFCHFDNLVLAAVHVALFLKPASITVFGCDNKVLSGKSHTTLLEYYDGGKVWPESETLRRQFATWEFGLDQLGRVALAAGIPLLRVGHI